MSNERAGSTRPGTRRGLRLLRRDRGALALFLGLQLGREGGPEVLGLKYPADLDLAVCRMRVGATLDPLDGFLHRPHLPEPEARDQLLGLRERPVDHGTRRSRELDALAPRRDRKSVV